MIAVYYVLRVVSEIARVRVTVASKSEFAWGKNSWRKHHLASSSLFLAMNLSIDNISPAHLYLRTIGSSEVAQMPTSHHARKCLASHPSKMNKPPSWRPLYTLLHAPLDQVPSCGGLERGNTFLRPLACWSRSLDDCHRYYPDRLSRRDQSKRRLTTRGWC